MCAERCVSCQSSQKFSRDFAGLSSAEPPGILEASNSAKTSRVLPWMMVGSKLPHHLDTSPPIGVVGRVIPLTSPRESPMRTNQRHGHSQTCVSLETRRLAAGRLTGGWSTTPPQIMRRHVSVDLEGMGRSRLVAQWDDAATGSANRLSGQVYAVAGGVRASLARVCRKSKRGQCSTTSIRVPGHVCTPRSHTWGIQHGSSCGLTISELHPTPQLKLNRSESATGG